MNALTSAPHKKNQYFESFDSESWSFRGNSSRKHGHGYFQYPAMMVPQMIETIIKELEKKDRINVIGDPFSGSGTVLTESMLKGKSFIGKDINPLSILLCKTKAGPLFTLALKNKANELLCSIKQDKSFSIEVSFPNQNKWFQSYIQIELSKIKRSIRKEPALWARRFFWTALAETIRLTSNSRVSTFKLHIRPLYEIEQRSNLNVLEIFSKILHRNLQYYNSQASDLKNKNLTVNGYYTQKINIDIADARSINSSENLLCDTIITSPPYGDNTSTVPYGQYSFLPLQWIDMEDISSNTTLNKHIHSAYEIDTKSLGGSKRISQMDKDYLCDISPSFKHCLDQLKDQPIDREKRVTAFFRDFHNCLPPTTAMLKPEGSMVWVLGNRQVGGVQVPFDKILPEMFKSHNMELQSSHTRSIPSKRMAIKNNISDTMSKETILIFKKK